jgi:hypothetical protein
MGLSHAGTNTALEPRGFAVLMVHKNIGEWAAVTKR